MRYRFHRRYKSRKAALAEAKRIRSKGRRAKVIAEPVSISSMWTYKVVIGVPGLKW